MDELAKLEYCDLFVAPAFADIKVRPGYHAPRTDVPPEFAGAIHDLRQALIERQTALRSPEFSFRIAGLLHRVTAMTTVEDETTFILRRATRGVRPLATLGLPPYLRTSATDLSLRGLILIAGSQASGKTTTMTSLFVERMRALGGVGVALEDPIETDGLEGLHGKGRIHHYAAARHEGGYSEQIIKTLRHGADAILIGEIREAEAAQVVVRESANGSTIFSTVHAGSISEALARLVDFFPSRVDGRAMLAHSLRLIIHQELSSNERGDSVLRVRSLSLLGKEAKTLQIKIAEGRFVNLEEDADVQSKRNIIAGWPAVSHG